MLYTLLCYLILNFRLRLRGFQNFRTSGLRVQAYFLALAALLATLQADLSVQDDHSVQNDLLATFQDDLTVQIDLLTT